MPNMGNPKISQWFNHSNKNIGITIWLDSFTLSMNESLGLDSGNNHTGCKGHHRGDLDRQDKNITSSYFSSIKNMIGACTFVPGIRSYPSVGGGRLWNLQVLKATTQATTRDLSEAGKVCGAFMQYQIAALMTGEINASSPIRSAITLPYIQISSSSAGEEARLDYWLWVDPWCHIQGAGITKVKMIDLKHGYYSWYESHYNPMDYYYYYDKVSYTVAHRWTGAGREWEKAFERRSVTITNNAIVVHKNKRIPIDNTMAWSRKNGKDVKNSQAPYTWWRGVQTYLAVPSHGYNGVLSPTARAIPTPRYPNIVQDSEAYPSLDPLFLMHGGRMTTAKYCGEYGYTSHYIASDLLGSRGSKATQDTTQRGNRWVNDTREQDGEYCSNTVPGVINQWTNIARKKHRYVRPLTVGAIIKGVITNTLNIGGAALTTAGDLTQNVLYTIGGWIWPMVKTLLTWCGYGLLGLLCLGVIYYMIKIGLGQLVKNCCRKQSAHVKKDESPGA
ncbi:unnamed protein product [Arctogadus glacialis]